MRKPRLKLPEPVEDRPTKDPEIDYSAKTPTMGEQIIFGIKLFAAVGIIFLLLWLMEKFAAL